MAKARKLPSGAWRTQASKMTGGKRVVRSFTVHPDETGGNSRNAKVKSELLAREWQSEIEVEEVCSVTVGEAIDRYIKDREKVLSPRSIRDYRALIPFFDPIKDICISDIKTSEIQALINEWSVNLGTKTIRNRTGFLMSVLNYSDCDRRFKLRYPQRTVKKKPVPDTDDLQRLLSEAADSFRPLIMLAAFGSLRRGEVCALKQKDISKDMKTVYVHADMIQTEKGIVYKDMPKTSGSVRTVQLPKFVIDSLPLTDDPEAFVFDYTINMVTSDFTRLRNKCGLECSFHSLRKYAASFRSDLKIPQKYIEEVGGWKNDSTVLRDVYDNALTSSRKKYTQIANKFIEDNFEDIIVKAKKSV